jgi:hypothetical protein
MRAVADPDVWTRHPEPGLDLYVSNDRKLSMDFGAREDGGYEIITSSKLENRGTMTVFNEGKPESHTIVGEFGAYTATPAFCKILKKQTNSKTFKDMAKNAATCKDFYARTDISDSGMSAHIATHRANIQRMKTSSAKTWVQQDEILNVFSTDRIKASFGVGAASKPRAILSKSVSPNDIKDRQAIADLAGACGRLWDNIENPPVTEPVEPPAGSAKSQKVKK